MSANGLKSSNASVYTCVSPCKMLARELTPFVPVIVALAVILISLLVFLFVLCKRIFYGLRESAFRFASARPATCP